MIGKDIAIDIDDVISGLKDFQRDTVEYVFTKLYEEDSTNRFLIADEVGLGKTLVAKGIVAKTIDRFKDEINAGEKGLNIIYICSNGQIARQNMNRLNIMSQDGFTLATRITLLPIQLERLKENPVNLISLTPGTSFDLRSSGGVMEERALIYHILRKRWGFGNSNKYKRFFQCRVGDNWNNYLKWFYKKHRISRALEMDFIDKLDEEIDFNRRRGQEDIRSRLERVSERFAYNRRISHNTNGERNRIISQLRYILAKSCIYSLEPDLIILDEFQRFKDLLYYRDGEDEHDNMKRLAWDLFNYAHARILLLSATPYRMYTMNHELDDGSHYDDFLETARFLLDSGDRSRDLEKRLKYYKSKLIHGDDGFDDLWAAKVQVEEILKDIMVRTERVGFTKNHDSMIVEKSDGVELKEEELLYYMEMSRISDALGSRDLMEYWKSSPYLLNFMENNYKLKSSFEQKIRSNPQLMDIIREGDEFLLSWEDIDRYRKVDPANFKLRTLMDNTINRNTWKLLWVPPSLPYYAFSGVYDDPKIEGFTKSLVFSSWHLVPRVISSITSYEAERRMVELSGRNTPYDEQWKPLINFVVQEGKANNMNHMTLLYPCITLAKRVDPLKDGREICKDGKIASYNDIYDVVYKKIVGLLEACGVDIDQRSGRADSRWYWASLAIMDRHYYRDDAGHWLGGVNRELDLRNIIRGKGEDDGDSGFSEHVDTFYEFFKDPKELGPLPEDLVHILTIVALASPAVVALRALARKWKDLGTHCLYSAARIADGFRTMYDLPDSINLIRGIKVKGPYWKNLLEYGADGNLQALMDEYVHILYESLGLYGLGYEEGLAAISESIMSSVSLRTAHLGMDEIRVDPQNGNIDLENRRLRCRYGLRFSEERNDVSGEVTRQETVREAFNSPFKPFILATTSIGQEGLDFHQYCHSVYHWNLPSNPIDLEQREGRIHRYKGHVIRRNLALKYGLVDLYRNYHGNGDPWNELFNMAVKNRREYENDLIPFWIFDLEDGYKIERHIPILPLSRDAELLKNLKATIAAYRMVFGQPRQEDLVHFMTNSLGNNGIDEISRYKIDLSP